ncbi:hypothetical protein NQ315_003276 [Exocentrus adspersus]|uniref:Prolactin receptor n=1 Tax=Exocentrus adspersus TaxID=1586481 RepID=A0AAV8VCS3_9CUCU|nr:hypothetical protein NQ315_003276 [Exocentrus adspersus]
MARSEPQLGSMTTLSPRNVRPSQSKLSSAQQATIGSELSDNRTTSEKYQRYDLYATLSAGELHPKKKKTAVIGLALIRQSQCLNKDSYPNCTEKEENENSSDWTVGEVDPILNLPQPEDPIGAGPPKGFLLCWVYPASLVASSGTLLSFVLSQPAQLTPPFWVVIWDLGKIRDNPKLVM